MSRTEPDDLPDDYGLDEQAETLADLEPPADWHDEHGALLPSIPLGAALPDGRTVDDLRREAGDGLPAARAQQEALEGEVVTACPTCESHLPELHPATQADGGEVNLCPDPFHASTEQGRRTLEAAERREPDRAALPVLFANVAAGLVDGIAPDHLDAVTKRLKPGLIDAVRERVRQVRAVRPAVVTDADVFPLVRQLTYAEEVLRRIGTAWTGAADECRAIAGEELLTAKGEQDGIPTGRLIVPDGDGTEIVVRAKTTKLPDTYDVSGIVGVTAEAAARAVAAKGCECLHPAAGGDGPERDCPEHGDPIVVGAEVARLACHELLGLLSSPKWASTKLDAFARALSAAGHDADAGVLQQARVKGAEQWNGATEVVREEAKKRRRG